MALATATCYGQPRSVEALPVTPLPYGLFSVADMIEAGSGHWQQGLQWEPDLCGAATHVRCSCVFDGGEGTQVKVYNEDGVPLSVAVPGTVYASFNCSPIGNWDRAEERARRALLSGEERAVESLLAEGAHADVPSLYGTGTVDITPAAGTAIDVVAGLALLEQYIGENGNGQGVILAARRDVILANANGVQIYQNGSGLFTVLGTPVAALSGIDGKTGPNEDAPEANEAWLFALGSRPRIWRSEVFVTSGREASLNIQDNNLQILAERNYAIGWDCFTAAVLVTSVGTA